MNYLNIRLTMAALLLTMAGAAHRATLANHNT